MLRDTGAAERAVAVRPPRQPRSRATWERIIAVGLELLEEGGTDAMTVSEVCRRVAISPPSLYARVDGRAGLFAAVYGAAMERIHATEDELLSGLPRLDDSSDEEALAVTRALATLFTRHRGLLRPIIIASGSDEIVLDRGRDESRRLLERLVRALPSAGDTAYDLARTLFAECVVRTLYGPRFLTTAEEDDEVFAARLTLIAQRHLLALRAPTQGAKETES